jgi:hypothetical protein
MPSAASGGIAQSDPALSTAAASGWSTVQPAARMPRPRWRDTRLVVGVLLVLGSMVLGARVVAQAQETVELWAARTALVPGVEVKAEDLQRREVHIREGQNHYLTGPAPVGYVVTRAVGAGELVPASAVATFDEVSQDVRMVTISLPREEAPPNLAAGDGVDVWVASRGATAARGAELLAERVPVAAVPDAAGAFGTTGPNQPVVLALARGSSSGRDFTELVSALVSAAREGDVVLSLVPGPTL